ncbi:SpaA isopeptide-forming pilin-related protein, partial [Erysipelothrix rhusiopathiae]|nr:SpaA isopeptide-forming pilin-related protein [Erysipelothrix rhusiopathiae]
GFKTDVEGVISVDDLELGTYFFEEIIAPEGYALDATPHKVLVEGGNDSQPVQIVIENTKLAKPKGSLELIKVDANNRSKYLNDAEFILYREGQGGIEYLTEMNTWSLSSDDAQIFVTAHQGIIKINNLEFGTYYFKEVKAPQGYELDETPIEMIVGVHNPDGTVRFKNQLKTIPEIPEEPNKPVIPELPTIPKEPELPATGVSKQNYTLEISVSLISAGAYLIIKGKRRRNLL